MHVRGEFVTNFIILLQQARLSHVFMALTGMQPTLYPCGG